MEGTWPHLEVEIDLKYSHPTHQLGLRGHAPYFHLISLQPTTSYRLLRFFEPWRTVWKEAVMQFGFSAPGMANKSPADSILKPATRVLFVKLGLVSLGQNSTSSSSSPEASAAAGNRRFAISSAVGESILKLRSSMVKRSGGSGDAGETTSISSAPLPLMLSDSVDDDRQMTSGLHPKSVGLRFDNALAVEGIGGVAVADNVDPASP